MPKDIKKLNCITPTCWIWKYAILFAMLSHIQNLYAYTHLFLGTKIWDSREEFTWEIWISCINIRHLYVSTKIQSYVINLLKCTMGSPYDVKAQMCNTSDVLLAIKPPSVKGNPFYPNWHEAGHFYPHCNFGIGFFKLFLYQKFPNFLGYENWHQSS